MATAAELPRVGTAVGVVHRIEVRLPQMPAAMAKIGRYLLDHPQAPLEMSIMELARSCGTSAATVTRFCRLIGYPGYVPFRVGIAADLGRSDARESWTTDIGRAFSPDDSPRDVLSTLVNAHTRSLQETAALLDLPVVEEVAGRIAASSHVDIYGIGGSAVMADEMQSRLYRIGINTHAWSEVHAGLTSAAIQDERCVALAVSNTGRTEETIQMLRQAGAAGATTVALTNDPESPLAAAADLQITTSVHERFLQPDDLSAKHVQLLVLDLLYLMVAQDNFGRATAQLAASAIAVSSHRRELRTTPTTRRRAGGRRSPDGSSAGPDTPGPELPDGRRTGL